MSQTQLRVLQILPAFETGGVEQGTFDIAHALVETGKTAFIASEGGQMQQHLPPRDCTHISVKLNTKNPVSILKNSFTLKNIIEKNDINIVHARSRAPAWSGWLACKLTNTPFLTTFHSTYGYKNFIKRWYNAIMVKGTHIIAISQFIKDHIQNVYSGYLKPNSKIHIVHRCVDLKKFHSKSRVDHQSACLKKAVENPKES